MFFAQKDLINYAAWFSLTTSVVSHLPRASGLTFLIFATILLFFIQDIDQKSSAISFLNSIDETLIHCRRKRFWCQEVIVMLIVYLCSIVSLSNLSSTKPYKLEHHYDINPCSPLPKNAQEIDDNQCTDKALICKKDIAKKEKESFVVTVTELAREVPNLTLVRNETGISGTFEHSPRTYPIPV